MLIGAELCQATKINCHKLYQLLKLKNYNPNDDLRSPGIKHVGATFASNGLGHLWLNERDGYQTNYVNNAVKLRLNDAYQQIWHSSMEQNSQFTVYAALKDLQLKKYLKTLMYKDRLTMSKFRHRKNHLPATRNSNAKNSNITCELCNCGDIGDEFH